MKVEQLGDYIIQKSLGQGPFGEIFLAEHRFIKKSFILKVLPEEISSDPFFLRRFEMQISDIANLDHPNIAKIYNVSIQDQMVFIVMEPLIDSLGESMNLDRYLSLKSKALTEEDHENFLRQIAEAIDYAHSCGVPHGGLKLTNILVSSQDHKAKWILSDFGIYRLIGERAVMSRIADKLANYFSGPSEKIEGQMKESAQLFIKNRMLRI